MKKLFLILTLVLACTLVFCSCGKDETPYDFDLKEYVTLGQFPDVEFDEEDFNTHMNEAIEEITANETVTTDITDRAVEKGDIVNIDYVGTKDGEEFSGGSAKGADLEIGSGSFIPGFEDGLIGKNIGDEVKLDLVFPEDYSSAPELAGEEVVFTVTINSIKAETHPALTDAMVEEHTEFKSVSEFIENKTEEIAKDVLWEKYLASCKVIQYPKDEVKVYYDNLVSSYSQMAVYNGMTLETMVTSFYGYSTLDDFLSYVLSTAKASVKEEMVIYLTARENNFTVSDEEYKEKGETLASQNGFESLKEYEKAMTTDIITLEVYRDKLLDMAFNAHDDIKYEAPPVEEETEAGSAEEAPEETNADETKEVAAEDSAEETKEEAAESSAETAEETAAEVSAETSATTPEETTAETAETAAEETKAEPAETNA